MAGHSVMITGAPTKFDRALARHFVFVESTVIVPTFCLSIVHYWSSFFSSPERVSLLPAVQGEVAARSEMLCHWTRHIAPNNEPSYWAVRLGALAYQFATFPLWLCLTAAAPALVHGAIGRSDHILYHKYGAIEPGFPAIEMHGRYVTALRNAEKFHMQQAATVNTDVLAGIVLVFLTLLGFGGRRRGRSGAHSGADGGHHDDGAGSPYSFK